MRDDVELRDVEEGDLPIFFEHQREVAASEMAAFPPRGGEEFMQHWAKIAGDRSVVAKTIVFRGEVAGNVVSWDVDGERAVGYWIGSAYWGKGVASRALAEFLQAFTPRPLHAHVARHNVGSLQVLQKCGFIIEGEAKVPYGAPGEEITEYLLRLD